MIRWVVTGPIGAGKSSVTELLRQAGAAVVDGDLLGHEVLADPEVVREIQAEFGSEVAPDGIIDRSILGPLVFAEQVAMDRLNAITHGRISDLADRRLQEWENQGNHELAVLEAAVYFLFPSPPSVDLVISVVADAEIRAARLAFSRKLTHEQVLARLAAQQHLDPLWLRADVVLENNGDRADLKLMVEELVDDHFPNGIQG